MTRLFLLPAVICIWLSASESYCYAEPTCKENGYSANTAGANKDADNNRYREHDGEKVAQAGGPRSAPPCRMPK
jgi:hypothetical protein